MNDFNKLLDAIDANSTIISGEVHREGTPRLTAHVLLDGKEYLVLVQPTDLPKWENGN